MNNLIYVINVLTHAQQWVKEHLPTELEIVSGLIEDKAFGRVSKGVLFLSDIAEAGTVYHEGFHYVSQYLLSKQELSTLYNEYRERMQGKKVRLHTGQEVLITDSTSNYIVEELLAESFRIYQLEGVLPDLSKQSKTFFDRILNFINKFLEFFGIQGFKKNENIETLFLNIAKGEYSKRRPTINANEFNTLNRVLYGLDDKVTIEIVNSAVSSFITQLFNNNKRKDIQTLFYYRKDSDKLIKDVLEKVYTDFDKAQARTYNTIIKLKEEGIKTEEDKIIYKKLVDKLSYQVYARENFFEYNDVLTQKLARTNPKPPGERGYSVLELMQEALESEYGINIHIKNTEKLADYYASIRNIIMYENRQIGM